MPMSRRHPSPVLASLALLVALGACDSDAAGPTHTDVDVARAAWVAGGYADYRFQLSMESSWFPRSDWLSVAVAGGAVVEVDGEWSGLGQSLPPTIEEVWAHILDARARGQLNRAEFDDRGVPVHADVGPWPVDGGVAYWIRSFAPGD